MAEDGQVKDVALRRGVLAYLAGAFPTERRPANWAHLVLTGNTESMNGKTMHYAWLGLGIAASLLLLALVMRKRKTGR